MPPRFDALGSYLREAREHQGITLDGIAETTKIQVKFLQAIEEDAYDQLPVGPYATGFLRAYAQSLSLNPEEILAAYQEQCQSRFPADSRVRSNAPELHRSRPLRLQWLVLGLLSVLLVAVYVRWPIDLVSPFSSLGANAPLGSNSIDISAASVTSRELIPAAAALATSGVPPSMPSPFPRMVISPEPLVRRPASVSLGREPIGEHRLDVLPDRLPPAVAPELEVAPLLVLRVMAIEETWISVDIDGDTHHEVLLQSGEIQRWQAKTTFVLTIGNTWGTQVWLNDQEVELPAGGRTVLRNFTLTRQALN